MQTEKEYITERDVLGVHSESVGEYPLPDYNGDVKRVLMISPTVLPTGKYMNESSLELSGNVRYEIVYLDAENNVAHTSFCTDYELAVKQDADSYEDSDVSTSVSSYNVRLVSPRKFSAKASLSSDVRIRERRSLEIIGDALADGDAETLTRTAEILTPVMLYGETEEIRGDVAFADGAIEDEITVLSCDVSRGEAHICREEDGCELKCNLSVKVVWKNVGEPISVRELDLPYSARFESAELERCASLFARVTVGETKCELLPGDDGVGIAVSVGVTPGLYGIANEALEVVCDAFLEDKGTSNEYRDFVYSEHIASGSADKAFVARIPLSEVSDSSISEIVCCDCVVSREGCEIVDEGVSVTGEIRFNAIAREETENGDNYINLKFSLPFEQIVNINCQIHDNMRPEACVEAYGPDRRTGQKSGNRDQPDREAVRQRLHHADGGQQNCVGRCSGSEHRQSGFGYCFGDRRASCRAYRGNLRAGIFR